MENPWRWLCVHLCWIFWPDNFYYRIKDVWDGFGTGHPPTNTRFVALRYSNGTTGFTRLSRILPRHKTGNKVVCNNIIAYSLERLHFAEFFVATCPASLLAAVFAIMQKRLRPIRPEWGQRPGFHCRDPVSAIRGRVARLIVDLDETEGKVATTGAPRWAPIVATCSSALLAASSLISSWSTRGHSARALIILRTEDHDVLEPLAGAPQVWSQSHCVRRRGNACRHTPSRLCQKFSRSFFCITGKKERDVETYCHKWTDWRTDWINILTN